MAEKKIGEEVERGRAEGTILKAREHRRWADAGGEPHQYKASLAELGLTKQQNRDFREMAEVPAAIIHQTVEAANGEGKVATKASMKRAEPPSPHRPVAPPGRASRPGGLEGAGA